MLSSLSAPLAWQLDHSQATLAPSDLPTTLTHTFPNYTDPVAAGPAFLSHDASCTVQLFAGIELRDYDQVDAAPYAPPSGACAGPWSSVTLRFHGAVAGTQYDRFGGLWLGGVQLLRTTTPEPSPAGITWAVDSDVTAYSSLFAHPSNATLTIPNQVTDTYTGVLRISASLLFVPARGSRMSSGSGVSSSSSSSGGSGISSSIISGGDSGVSNSSSSGGGVSSSSSSDGGGVFGTLIADEVHSVLSPTAPHGASSPWALLSVSGTGNVSGRVRLAGRAYTRAEVHVYASAHEAEEFWYSNAPDALTNATGAPGGGVYREIEISIDGIPAGAAYPFPTVYSGGINPILWRPLAGTHSLSIPPLTFDVSPLLPLLNDGRGHVISARVLSDGLLGSVWYIDPVLMLWRSASSAPLSGRVTHAERSPPRVHTNTSRTHGPGLPTTYHVHTRGSSGYSIEGELWPEALGAAAAAEAAGSLTRYAVSGTLAAKNANTLEGYDNGSPVTTTATTVGELSYSVESRVGASCRTSSYRYPYRVSDQQRSDNNSFLLSGQVRLTAHRREEAASGLAGSRPAVLQWSSTLASTAVYNRSTDANRTIYREESNGTSTFAAPAACFRQDLSVSEGAVVTAHFADECPRSELRAALCTRFGACAASRAGINAHVNAPSGMGGDESLRVAAASDGRRAVLPYRSRRGSSAFR